MPLKALVRLKPAEHDGATDRGTSTTHRALLANLALALPSIGPCLPAAFHSDSRAVSVQNKNRYACRSRIEPLPLSAVAATPTTPGTRRSRRSCRSSGL